MSDEAQDQEIFKMNHGGYTFNIYKDEFIAGDGGVIGFYIDGCGRKQKIYNFSVYGCAVRLKLLEAFQNAKKS